MGGPGEAAQAAAADVAGLGRRSAWSSAARGRRPAPGPRRQATGQPRYLGQVPSAAERRRGREAVRLQPQRRRGGRRAPPRLDRSRPTGSTAWGRPSGPSSTTRLRRPDRDRGRHPRRRRPAKTPPPHAGTPRRRRPAPTPAPGRRRPAPQPPRPRPHRAAPAAAVAAAPRRRRPWWSRSPPAQPTSTAAGAGRAPAATPTARRTPGASQRRADPPKASRRPRSRSTRSRASASSARPRMTGRFVGQPNLDFTMPDRSDKKEPKPDELQEGDTDPKDRGPADQKEEEKKAEVRRRKRRKKTPGRTRRRKPAEADDVIAPPPGTAAPAKIAKLEPKKNGIRDLHLSLSGLRNSPIKQVMVNCQTDKGPTSWRLDTSDSQDWPLVRPPVGDRVVGRPLPRAPARRRSRRTSRSTSRTRTARTATPRQGRRAHRRQARRSTRRPRGPAARRPGLPHGRRASSSASSRAIGEDSLKLTTPWQDHLDVPWPASSASTSACPSTRSRPTRSPAGSRPRGSEDLLLARTKDGEVVAIAGRPRGDGGRQAQFHYQGKTRTLPLEQVEGLVLAARPDPDPPDEVRGPRSRSPAASSSRAAGRPSTPAPGRSRPPGARS